MNTVKRMKNIFDILATWGELPGVHQMLQGYLDGIAPEDWPVIKQKLINQGVDIKVLNKYSFDYLMPFKDKVERMVSRLPRNHVIRKLVDEHDTILCFLDDLEIIGATICRLDHYIPEHDEFRHLKHILKHILYNEHHYHVEENILFVELEKQEIYGPIAALRKDHNDISIKLEQLRETVESIDSIHFNVYKHRLENSINYIIPALRRHIYKENHILFPIALKTIRDKSVWLHLNQECGFVPDKCNILP